MNIKPTLILALILTISVFAANAQNNPRHEDTEVYEPVPKVVTPGKTNSDAPSDAIILFDGKDLSQWTMTDQRGTPASWIVAGGILTVNKHSGNIETVKSFGSYQLHVEWRIPANITGSDQARGNSGVFLASLGKGDAGYELQVLDSYKNKTYVNGQAGSIYKQFIPLVNASKPPGEWQSYDIVWTAPTFNEDGTVKTPARATVFHNGVLVQNNVSLLGPTQYIGTASYNNAKHGPAPIKLQAHGDRSEPISYRNIWLREL
ncbi:DUF1080 domain-containing protein [Mucilaginibacter sp. UR6-11]|uniref:3-keto-disaccharide hydrolase n=1 Tax=Mucilaginibacter sp. UR6-11 TaxID=1435644 RepID=UPI001E5961E1|nr:DUF1080 domain-containing protein [Mucilaginibacter sp. UR6-11]MCC8426252.1 DUF1080 domain-containing protein [Mucilaginibacter sp. UR6-11]